MCFHQGVEIFFYDYAPVTADWFKDGPLTPNGPIVKLPWDSPHWNLGIVFSRGDCWKMRNQAPTEATFTSWYGQPGCSERTGLNAAMLELCSSGSRAHRCLLQAAPGVVRWLCLKRLALREHIPWGGCPLGTQYTPVCNSFWEELWASVYYIEEDFTSGILHSTQSCLLMSESLCSRRKSSCGERQSLTDQCRQGHS